MRKTRILAFILVIVLIAASAMMYSCKKDEGDENVLGSGATSFTLKITDDKGELSTYTVKTDEKTLGDALVKVELTKDEGFINTLNGITADFTVDEGWWKILINGEEAQFGAFDIEVKKDATYSFEYTKGFDMGDLNDSGDSEDLNDSEAEAATEAETEADAAE